jgi:threonylcarbamoyladenosine tRNA methylthiotransferase MtaB
MVESLTGEGYREIVLTGIHLGKYGEDLKNGTNLNLLLRDIGREGFPVRIRLSSLHPDEIDPELIDMAASEPWLCRHFHISLQSGDDEILKRMNRRYTVKAFAGLIESIYYWVPHAAMGVDIISGFPGEDDAAHADACALIRDLPVSYLHVFPFSSRPGTVAARLDGQVDPKVIKKRASEWRFLGKVKRKTFYDSCVNTEFLTLAERWETKEKKRMRGTTDNYLPVDFPSAEDLRGRIVPVKMKRVEKGRVVGTMQGETEG